MAKTEDIGKKVASALDGAMQRVEGVGTTVGSTMQSLMAVGGKITQRVWERPGAPPGIEEISGTDLGPSPGDVIVDRIDYGPGKLEMHSDDYEEALLDVQRPEDVAVHWLDIRGLHPKVVDQVRRRIGMHTLAAEDVLHVPQRPRVDTYEGHLFVAARLLTLKEGRVAGEQMSFFLFQDKLVSFQEDPDDSWVPIRRRLEKKGSKLRTNGPDFLLYALLDTLVDHCFPIIEHYHQVLEDLEDEVLDGGGGSNLLERTHQIKRDLALLRRVMWPTRDLIGHMIATDSPLLSQQTRVYLRDVHGHAVQVAEALDTLREVASGLIDLYISASSHRTNETMRVLTVTATLFIPMTFLAGVYGMNFQHMPELSKTWAYPTFWVICIVVTTTLLWIFRRRGWLGGG